MNILFIHQNFPGQFKFLAPALVQQGHKVVALTMKKTDLKAWEGVDLVRYSASRGTTHKVHPWVSDFETKTIRGEACFHAALNVKAINTHLIHKAQAFSAKQRLILRDLQIT